MTDAGWEPDTEEEAADRAFVTALLLAAQLQAMALQ